MSVDEIFDTRVTQDVAVRHPNKFRWLCWRQQCSSRPGPPPAARRREQSLCPTRP